MPVLGLMKAALGQASSFDVQKGVIFYIFMAIGVDNLASSGIKTIYEEFSCLTFVKETTTCFTGAFK